MILGIFAQERWTMFTIEAPQHTRLERALKMFYGKPRRIEGTSFRLPIDLVSFFGKSV